VLTYAGYKYQLLTKFSKKVKRKPFKKDMITFLTCIKYVSTEIYFIFYMQQDPLQINKIRKCYFNLEYIMQMVVKIPRDPYKARNQFD
jgi:hypothetical protein